MTCFGHLCVINLRVLILMMPWSYIAVEGGGVPVGAGLSEPSASAAQLQLPCTAILELFIQLEVLAHKVSSYPLR